MTRGENDRKSAAKNRNYWNVDSRYILRYNSYICSWIRAESPDFSWQTMKLNDMRAGGSKMQYRNTRQRKIVLEAVQEHHDHPSADQIYLEIRAKDPRISRGTVYRNLILKSSKTL